MPKSEGTGLTFWQAILLGFIPALLTGVFGIVGIQISEHRQDKRQLRAIEADQTAEAQRTQVAQALDPGPPPSPIPAPLPTITPMPEGTPEATQPQQIIIDYYIALNDGDYLTAWNLLSEDFRQRILDNDYQAYEAFWAAAGIVSVVELAPTETNQFAAEALVRLYWESERRTRAYRYSLILDLATESWKIDKVLGAG